MQVARSAKFSNSATISLLFRKSACSLCRYGSLSVQSPAVGEANSSCSYGSTAWDGDYLREQREAANCPARGGGWQLCGRGDKRTKKGKRFNGSFGNCRHRKNWDTQRLREKWEMPAGPAPGSLLPRPFPPLLTRF